MELSLYNLYRVRLRTVLTVSGVVIAIAAFVGMLSFGAGNARYVEEIYDRLGLLTNVKIYPIRPDPDDTTKPAALDNDAIDRLQEIPGVKLVYPFVSIDVRVQVGDTVLHAKTRALSQSALRTPLFTELLMGHTFSSDTANEAIIAPGFLEDLSIDDPDSLIGRTIVLTVESPSLDSAVLNVFDDGRSSLWKRMREIRYDSLYTADYRSRVVRRELSEGLSRFVDGFFNRPLKTSDTLTIVGVGSDFRGFHVRLDPIIIPEGTARRLLSQGFPVDKDPASLLAAIQSGNLFEPERLEGSRTYSQVTMEIDPMVPARQIADSITALGYRPVSYALQFEEMQRFFTYYYLALGAIGFIALITASLGIVNTMVMAVIERRREIGVLLSLGADQAGLRIMYLVEAGVIGALGGIFGILFGWLGSRSRRSDTGGGICAAGLAYHHRILVRGSGKCRGRTVSGGAGRARRSGRSPEK
jgi:putative ABC transport system permease protein